MAERRMFAKTIINSARFLKMPSETQALYFHLGLNADDDGIVEAFNVVRMLGVSEDSLKILVAKGFVQVLNDDLVSYILDWNEHNKIRPDRKIDSIYKDLLLQINPTIELIEKKPRSDLKKNTGQPMDNQWTADGQHRIGKDRIGEDRLGKDSIVEKDAPFSFSLKRETQYENLSLEYKNKLKEEIAKLNMELSFIDFTESLMAKGYKYKNFLLAYKNWAKKDFNKQNSKQSYIDRCINESARTYEAPVDEHRPF